MSSCLQVNQLHPETVSRLKVSRPPGGDKVKVPKSRSPVLSRKEPKPRSWEDSEEMEVGHGAQQIDLRHMSICVGHNASCCKSAVLADK